MLEERDQPALAELPETECETTAFDAHKVARLTGRIHEVGGLAAVFRILGDETRTKVLYALSQEELCVHDLAELLGITPSAVSHHLRLLRAMRLVRSRKAGKVVYYSLQDRHIVDLIQVAREHYLEEG